MKNIDVINAFFNGEDAKTKNVKSQQGRLINYSTVIAVKVSNTVYLNNEKYSQTTSTIQNAIRRQSPYEILEKTESELNNLAFSKA